MICSWITLATFSSYAASDQAFYAALKVSISEDSIDEIKASGIGNGQFINGRLDGRLRDTALEDYTAGLGFAVGVRRGYWNVGIEYTYRYRTDWDVAAATDSIQTITNVFTDVESQSVMLNVARRGPLTPYWSWEVGVGFGFTRKALDAQYIERETIARPEQQFSSSEHSTEFSYSAFVGVTHDLGGAWTLNSRLRFINLGELEVGPFPNRAARLSADQSAIELQFSLERNF